MDTYFLIALVVCLCVTKTMANPTLGVRSDPLVQTSQGAFRGAHVDQDVDAFLGIPYAQPPIGRLRFLPAEPMKPEPDSNSSTISDATHFGPVCYQFIHRSVLGDAILPTTEQSEDCLTLNIFRPRNASCHGQLPVFVWSFGGAFAEGGGSVPLYNPSGFVAENKDIILVTWNYRLNIFGFPNSPALDAQNLGIRDQRTALEWIRDNIANFGGDPNRIVLGGQSAGIDTGHAMLYSHPNDPIISGIAMQSGTVQVIGAVTENADAEFVRVASAVGCRDESDRENELTCMRAVDAATLRRGISNETTSFYGSPSGGGPMVDNATIFTLEEYTRRGKAGAFARIPTLMGSTDNEGDGVMNWDATEGINQSFADIVTTTLFTCNMALESSFRALHDVKVWRYRYMGIFPAVNPFSWLRAYHLADVPILLGSFGSVSAPNPTTQYDIDTAVMASQFLQRVFGSFVRDPAEGLGRDHGWPVFSPNASTLMQLFPNNTIGMVLSEPSQYDAICDNPPAIPWEQLLPH